MNEKETAIREYRKSDTDRIVDLALRAWAPVFESTAVVLGPKIYMRMYPDWRRHQERSVRETLDRDETWIAEADDTISGFVSLIVNQAASVGEIDMIAVDPDFQGKGFGALLTEFSLGIMREREISLAIVNTGGDPGHLPARRTYEKAGFTALPLVAYHKLL